MSGAPSAAAKGSTAVPARLVAAKPLLKRSGYVAVMHRILPEVKRRIGEAASGQARPWYKADSAVHVAGITKTGAMNVALPKLSTWLILALVVAITGGSPPSARAAEGRSAHALVQVCEAEQGAATSWCSAYLMGVADALSAFGAGGHKGGLCGAPYAIEDLGKVFLTWTRANPQLLDLDMLAGASLALRQTWPCR